MQNSTPTDVDDGGGITNDGTWIFVLRGDNKKDFWRYDTGGGGWSELHDAPKDVDDGGAITYGHDAI